MIFLSASSREATAIWWEPSSSPSTKTCQDWGIVPSCTCWRPNQPWAQQIKAEHTPQSLKSQLPCLSAFLAKIPSSIPSSSSLCMFDAELWRNCQWRTQVSGMGFCSRSDFKNKEIREIWGLKNPSSKMGVSIRVLKVLCLPGTVWQKESNAFIRFDVVQDLKKEKIVWFGLFV